jgi:hypothetical protein
MTSQAKQPHKTSPSDQPPGYPVEFHSPQRIAQPINTLAIQPQYTALPEQKGPGWIAPSRPMPATLYKQTTSTAQLSPSQGRTLCASLIAYLRLPHVSN